MLVATSAIPGFRPLPSVSAFFRPVPAKKWRQDGSRGASSRSGSASLRGSPSCPTRPTARRSSTRRSSTSRARRRRRRWWTCGCRKPRLRAFRPLGLRRGEDFATAKGVPAVTLAALGMRVHEQAAVAPGLRHHGITLRPARTDDATHQPRAVQLPCRLQALASAWVLEHRPPVTGDSAPCCSTRNTQPGSGGDGARRG